MVRPVIVADVKVRTGCKGSGSRLRCALVATILAAFIVNEVDAARWIGGGNGVGVAVGVLVGLGVGLPVGFGVGLPVGFGVGLPVGDGVGVVVAVMITVGVGVGVFVFVGVGVGVLVAVVDKQSGQNGQHEFAPAGACGPLAKAGVARKILQRTKATMKAAQNFWPLVLHRRRVYITGTLFRMGRGSHSGYTTLSMVVPQN